MRVEGGDQDDKAIGIKKVSGGALQESLLLDGVAFAKTFSYAGFEQQPKRIPNPRIACLNLELELRAERDNAEIRVDRVEEYGRVVDAEWSLIFSRLQRIADSGANVVLSRLAIGDVATQWFADRGIFCAGRVSGDDLTRIATASGATVISTLDFGQIVQSATALASNGASSIVGSLGQCRLFEERQLGKERFNYFEGCLQEGACTVILRGGSDLFLGEVQRSLHDAIMIVRRTLHPPHPQQDNGCDWGVVGGAGALEADLASFLRRRSLGIHGTAQLVYAATARAFECIPRQLAENAGLDSLAIMAALRKAHANPDDDSHRWHGVDILGSESVACIFTPPSCTNSSSSNGNNDFNDNGESKKGTQVWEPALVRINAIGAACEAACTILSVDACVSLSGTRQAQAAATNNSEFASMAARAGAVAPSNLA